MTYKPCSLCGNYGHYAPECHLAEPAPTLPDIEVSLTVRPSPEEQMVTLLTEIRAELEQIRKMLANEIPPAL